ncbi:TetR/AcrR family transcriptional regulator [Nocardia uniformis]|uniref:TetR/AcrR family transcriptional regulator n=1 Tax=Nocardia uniformis TaxID=53432 RepID=A0A849BSG3_9NOCA|nr:TetR/AcrR family transcriptional regulator [Nocardia uniformis]NNH69523.1 TetR/AcrR family transcriptional regulator [Nocardia uniformis]
MSIRSRYHHGDLRSALLKRAEATLREVGADGLSLRQLARDIGVSHAAPSRHFRDKQALLDELAASGFERLGQCFAEATTEGPVTDRLYGMARAYLRFAVENPELLALMFARKNLSSTPAMAEAVQQAFTVPVALIAEGQAAGEIVAGDPKRLGITAIAALQGVATLVGSDFTPDYDADQLLRDMVRYLTDGLRPRP